MYRSKLLLCTLVAYGMEVPIALMMAGLPAGMKQEQMQKRLQISVKSSPNIIVHIKQGFDGHLPMVSRKLFLYSETIFLNAQFVALVLSPFFNRDGFVL